MAITWKKAMSTGIMEVDEQHQELIKVLNTLDETIQTGKGTDQIKQILDFAGQYAQKHFRCEEAYFEQYQCPASALNKQEHAQFILKFSDLMQEFQQQGAKFSLVIKIHQELSDWLIQHILGVDIQLQDAVRKAK
jgi:hemerythrin